MKARKTRFDVSARRFQMRANGELLREALAEEHFAGADDDDEHHRHADALHERAESRIAPGTRDTTRSCCSRPARSGRS